MRSKTVTLICHGLITVEPEALVAWEDVWVRYRDGGKRKSYGPTLTGRADLDGELGMHHKLYEENKAEHPDWYVDDIAEMERVAALLDGGQRVVIGNDWEHGTPTLYFAEDYFDQAGAEEMIRAMLAHLGESNIRLQWRRETDIVVQGISIAPKRLRECAI